MLEVNNLLVTQGNFKLKANFSIKNGCMTAIIGPSGGGKSTLLSAIAGFTKLDEGHIKLNGALISEQNPSKVPCTLLFQDNNLFPNLNVFDNVALGINPGLKLTVSQKDEVFRVLSRVELSAFCFKMPNTLSGGQISRVALARALLRGKPMLMLDEAFGALGPAQRHEMLNFVKEIVTEANLILLMVTHDPSDAKQIVDQVLFVEKGTVGMPINVKKFFEKPTSTIKAYLGN